MLTNC